MKLLLSLLLFMFADVCLAQTNPPPSAAQTTNQLPDKITIDGVSYENVRWQKPTPSGVEIFHKSGIATIPMEKLPKELQERFGYDPDRAAAYRKTQVEQLELRRQQQEQALEEAEKGKERFLSAVAKRQESERQQQEQRAQAEAQREAETARAELFGIRVVQALSDGCIVSVGNDNSTGYVPGGRFYVDGLTNTYDDALLVIVVARTGSDFTYTTVSGTYKKLPRYRYLGKPDGGTLVNGYRWSGQTLLPSMRWYHEEVEERKGR